MTTDQHLADLLGLDLTDPEVIGVLAEQREITTIRARVHEVLTRTGTTEAALIAMLGITADKTWASLAGERRWSTYELAVIATHGGTTLEWLCGDDDPMPPETAAGLADLHDRPDPFTTWTGQPLLTPEAVRASLALRRNRTRPRPLPMCGTGDDLLANWAPQTDDTPLPMPRPEYRYESMLNDGEQP